MDHRDRWNFYIFEAVDHCVRAADRRLDGGGIGRAAEFVDIGAGDKSGFLRGADDDPGRALSFQRCEHRIKFRDDIGRQRVGATAFAVEQ